MIAAAKEIARRSPHRWAFHAAIVIRGGAVISTGYNHGTIHAEVNALKNLWPSKRRGTKVLSIRLSRTGVLRQAKPCKFCLWYMREAGVKVVLYSTEDGRIERMKL